MMCAIHTKYITTYLKDLLDYPMLLDRTSVEWMVFNLPVQMKG